ncbi:MAG: phospholipase [Alphaproteobacteria bacterium]|nr:MAG: phospholipase [Alphaproteobacteria bacterium]
MKLADFSHKLIRGPESGEATGAIIFLHGYGSNGHDMISLADHWINDHPTLAYIAPNAPTHHESSAFGYQWFSLQDRSHTALMDGLAHTTASLNSLIDDVTKAWKIPSHRIVLVGFSQGCMLGIYHGLYSKHIFGGVIGFSGRVIPNNYIAPLHKPPLLLIHGGDDDVVLPEDYHEGLGYLHEHRVGYEALFRPHLGHNIDEAGIQASRRFLNRIFQTR